MSREREWLPPTTPQELDNFADLIMDGKFALETPLRHLMCTSLSSCPRFDELAVTKDKRKRVDMVHENFPSAQFRKILKSIDKVLLKNVPVRSILESRGDVYKRTKDHENAVFCYTLALSFAPIHVVVAHVKRATIFISMKKYEAALVDIQIALHDERCQTLDMRTPLLMQKTICESFIVPKVEDEEDIKRKEYTDQVISKVKGHVLPSTALPEFISVKHHPIKGRYLVTNKDLEPGTTVLAQNPYICVPLNQMKWQTKNCVRCLKETSNPIPCVGCVFCIYCDEKCRAEDQKYGHNYECPILPLVHCLRIPPNFAMSLRAICRSGPEVMKAIWMKSKSVKRAQDAWFVPPEDTAKNRNPYCQVLNMASHARARDMPISTWMALSLSYALQLKTTFFDKIMESQKTDFRKFLAIIILHHSESFPYNTMGLGFTGYEIKDLKAYLEEGTGGPSKEAAYGIFPLANLVNHSCAPATFRHSLPGGRIAMITNRALKVGDELSHSYGFNHLSVPFDQRTKELLEYYRISCDCSACVNGWPMYKDMDTTDTFPFVCKRCRAHIQKLLTNTPLKEISMDQLKCGRCTCRTKNPETLEMESCDPFSFILEASNELVLNNKPLEAVPLLIECIKHFQKDLSEQPSVQMVMAQDRLMNCYSLITKAIIPPKELKTAKKSCSIV